MKALTVWQPWASLIMAGFKPYEFRGWSAPRYVVGQRIVLHASARTVRPLEVRDILKKLTLEGFCGGMSSAAIPFLEDVLMSRRRLPLGAGLGTVLLGEPKRSCDLWPDDFAGYSDSDRARVSNWAWPMLEIERFEPIVPMRGHQGFWNWPGALAGQP